MRIQTSLDWANVERKLEHNIRQIQTTRDVIQELRVLWNIRTMVSELSEEEIECRRVQHQTRRHKELLDKINEAIYNYEQMTFVACLTLGVK